MVKMADLTGKQFGEWTVLEFIGKKGKCYNWKCVCVCGTVRSVGAGSLRSGHSKNCGCQRIHDKHNMAGQRFGRLLVLESVDKITRGSVLWKCQCDCGNITTTSRQNLMAGHTQSCGCLHDEILKNYLHFEGTSPAQIRNKTIQKNNTSGVTGVYWIKSKNKWCARIAFKHKVYYLGYYKGLKDATKIRKQAEEKIFGEFLEWYDSRFLKSKELIKT